MSSSDFIIGHIAFKVKYKETGIYTPVHISVTSINEADLVARENFKKLGSVIDKQSVKLLTPSKRKVLKDYTIAELQDNGNRQNHDEIRRQKKQLNKREINTDRKIHKRKI